MDVKASETFNENYIAGLGSKGRAGQGVGGGLQQTFADTSIEKTEHDAPPCSDRLGLG